MSAEQAAKQRLVYAILKFLGDEIQAESVDAERRESIEGILSIYSRLLFQSFDFFSRYAMS